MDTDATTPETQAAPEQAPAQTTPPEPPRYRLMAREARRFDFPLSLEERAQIGDRVADLGRELRALQVEHEKEIEVGRDRIKALKSECAEASKARREAIAEAAEDFDNAIAAHSTGIERRNVDIERRAIVASATIEVVRLDTGEVVETRAMNEAEQQKWCRQGTIEDVTGGATVTAGVTEGASAEPSESDDADEAAATKGDPDALDEGEADALGLPVGWPRSWRGKVWQVKGAELAESDVLEVYLRLTAAGVTLDALMDGTEGVQGLDAMGVPRASVGRALAMLRKKGLADRGEGKGVWVLVDRKAARSAPEEEPEPGRRDPLPEAADAPRPKRQGKAATKADKLVNAAAEQSDGWGL